ncbi:MAG: NDP-sugar synthase [Elusimicrobiota bacterium]
MQAFILIGGYGTRLRPLTLSVPKPLLPVVNRAFLDYQLDLLERHGVDEVVFCVSYLSDSFKKYYSSLRYGRMKIHFSFEEKPLGTAGALWQARKYFKQPAFILNGDILTDLDLSIVAKYHRKNGAIVTIALTRVKDPTIYGLVELNARNQVQRFLEKPSWDEVTSNTINAGIYILEPQILDYIPDNTNFSLERNLYPTLLTDEKRKHKVYGYVATSTYWLDIGTPEKFLLANYDVMEHNIKVPSKFLARHAGKLSKDVIKKNHITCHGNVVVGKNNRIGKYVQLSGNVCLGNNCELGQGVVIKDCVILDDAKIGEGVKIESSIIGRGCIIEGNTLISEGAILGEKSVIRRYSKI